MAGIKVNESCILEFQDFKLRHDCGYIVYRISPDLKEVVIEQKGEPSANFDALLKSFPENDCRYAVTHVSYDKGADGKRSKVVFILWCPPTASVKHKLIYAATVEGLKRSLPGVQVQVQGSGPDDLELNEVIAKCQRNSTN
jgi:cofilin